MKAYGWNPAKLAEAYSTTELLALQEQVENEPGARNPLGSSIFLFTPATQKKLEAIRWALYHLGCEKRAAEGRPVSQAGYSGRQSKRRR